MRAHVFNFFFFFFVSENNTINSELGPVFSLKSCNGLPRIVLH